MESSVRTFLLTDVEGSTPMWDREPRAMAEAVALHDQLVAEVVTGHGGELVKSKGEGDSTFSVFVEAREAVAAAVAMQRTLSQAAWPTERPVCVRAAIHTGAAEARSGDWFGPTVIRAARLRGLAAGRQVLLSGAAASTTDGALPTGYRLEAVGEVTLRGLAERESVWTLVGPGLVRAAPPSDTPVTRRLPRANRVFVGREWDSARLIEMIDAGERLVTLIGPGGVGKTTLAAAVARRLAGAFDDGVAFVAAQELSDTGQLTAAAAAAVEAPAESELLAHLATQRLLLVLDNLEHLEEPGSWIDAVLERCPGVTVVATSRQRLDHPDEVLHLVAPLEASTDGVELLISLVRAARPGISLTEESRAAAERLAAALDGLPLAIELAAAATRTLALVDVEHRLAERLDSLSFRERSGDLRHNTLVATIEWSWRLLNDRAQWLLGRIALFPAGAPFDGLVEMADADGVGPDELLGALEQVVDHSLAAVDDSQGSSRYVLLDTVRRFAVGKLDDEGDGVRVSRLAQVLWAQQLARPPAQPAPAEREDWARRCALEEQNLRSALTWALGADGDAWEGGVLAQALLAWWQVAGSDEEAARLCQQAADAPIAPPVPRAELRQAVGHMFLGWNDVATAVQTFRRGIEELEPAAGDEDALGLLGWLWYGLGQAQDGDDAEFSYREALSSARAAGEDHLEAMVLNNLAVVSRQEGRVEECWRLAEEALAVARRAADLESESVLLGNMAGWRDIDDGPQAALALLDSAVDAAEPGTSGRWLLAHLLQRAHTRRRLGQLAAAEEDASRGVTVAAARQRRLLPDALAALSAVRFDAGDPEVARLLLDRALEITVPVSNRAAAQIERSRQLLVLGHHEEAAASLSESLELLAESRWYGVSRAVLTAHLACARAHHGALGPAAEAVRAAWAAAVESRERHATAAVLDATAFVLAAAGEHQAAARALGAATAVGDPSRLVLAPVTEALPGNLRRELGETAFATLHAEGRAADPSSLTPQLTP